MKLSSDLVKRFVKATKDTSKQSSEVIAYGTTVVKDDGSLYVILDGSDIETPATSAMSSATGDRVVVSIKNHSVVVTGNVTDPASNDGAEIEKLAGSIALTVKEDGTVVSKLTVDANGMSFVGDQFVVDTDEFKLDENGNAEFHGKLTVTTDNGENTITIDAGDGIKIQNGEEVQLFIDTEGNLTFGGELATLVEIGTGDLTQWSKVGSTLAYTPSCLSYGNGIIIMGTSSTTYLRSTDYGVTWSSYTSLDKFDEIAYGNNTFVGINYSNQYSYTSSDYGLTWVKTIFSYLNGDSTQSISFANGLFLASFVGDTVVGGTTKSILKKSSDGILWENIDAPDVGYVCTRIIYDGNNYVYIAKKRNNTYGLRIYSSSDLSNIGRYKEECYNFFAHDMTYHDGCYIIVGEDSHYPAYIRNTTGNMSTGWGDITRFVGISDKNYCAKSIAVQGSGVVVTFYSASSSYYGQFAVSQDNGKTWKYKQLSATGRTVDVVYANYGFYSAISSGNFYKTSFSVTKESIPLVIEGINNSIQGVENSVKYTPQTLSSSQQLQARDNIGIVGYTLPTASATILGGIKVGTDLSIDANSVLSVTSTAITIAEIDAICV